MDRRYIAALLLSLLILIGYPYYLKWVGMAPESTPAAPRVSREIIRETPRPAAAPAAPAEDFPLKNRLYEILFTSRGGNISFLKQGDTTFYRAGAEDPGIFGINLLYEAGDLSRETFKVEPALKENVSPRFIFERPGEYRLSKTYYFGNDKPAFILEIEIENLQDRDKHFPLTLQYAFEPGMLLGQQEAMVKMVRLTEDGRLQTTALSTLRKKPFLSTENIGWHGLTKMYEALLVKPDSKAVGYETRWEAERLVNEIKFTPLSVRPGEKAVARILIYAGPKSYEMLKSFGVGFERIVTNGMLGVLKLALLKTLHWAYRWTHNYGIAILLITMLIKLLFTPLTHMSYQSMGKMQALQPKVKALQKQHQKDPARLNKEMMELYRRNRVNPMAGCLPLLLQIPIFIAFYQMLSESVELKGAGFVGWIHDLSAPDRLFVLPMNLPFLGDAINLLPILMIGSMVWQQKLTPQTSGNPMQEKMMLLMPIVFGFIFYNLPSGLVLYWLANNLLTIFHQLVIKKIPVILHHEDAQS